VRRASGAQIMSVRFGRYTLKRRIAVGGMAEIFVAEAPGIAGFTKTVALKLILPELAAEGDFLRMFFDEAKLTSAMSHPNIAQVYELGEVSGRYFIAMEYVPGIDLARLTRLLAKENDSLPEPIALSILLEVLTGLHFAHDATNEAGQPLHLVHRDVSPHNMLLSRDGAVKITDFGIAKVATQSARTRTGLVKGKFSYMSPEQAWGRAVDRRADVFSAALVLYEILWGTRVYGREDEISIMQQARRAAIQPLIVRKPTVSPDLSRILERALAFDRDARFSTADAFRAALSNAGLPLAGPAEIGALVRRFAGDEDPSDDDGLDAIGLTGTRLIARKAAQPMRRTRMGVGLGALGLSATIAVWASWPSNHIPTAEAGAEVTQTGTATRSPTAPRPVEAGGGEERRVDSREPSAPEEPKPRERTPQATGYLTINTQPWAYVSIDGKRLPNPTPLRHLALRPGHHQVHLSSPSLGTAEDRIVDVRAGKTTTLFHQFSER
jgi:serine/threonine-protein kinase